VRDLAVLVNEGRRFKTIYADPPWPYDNKVARGAAERHYRTLSVEEIAREPVRELAMDEAHLHLWTTNAFLREAFSVMEAWGFRYKSCLVWVKPQMGAGNYWRVSHEFLLFGLRGRLRFRDRRQRSWIEAPRTMHSKKPGVVRLLIERVSPGPYLELYGREEIPDSPWTVYGNQVDKGLF
jgi:N6-adenosine-specific RNA methylase IME4